MKNNLLSSATPAQASGLLPMPETMAFVPYRCSVCDYPKGTEAGWCGRCHWYTAGARN